MAKKWKTLYGVDAECPGCGSSLEVLTAAKGIGLCYDGDRVRCVECDFQSGVTVDENGETWVQEI